jgi:hypothetical protein
VRLSTNPKVGWTNRRPVARCESVHDVADDGGANALRLRSSPSRPAPTLQRRQRAPERAPLLALATVPGWRSATLLRRIARRGRDRVGASEGGGPARPASLEPEAARRAPISLPRLLRIVGLAAATRCRHALGVAAAQASAPRASIPGLALPVSEILGDDADPAGHGAFLSPAGQQVTSPGPDSGGPLRARRALRPLLSSRRIRSTDSASTPLGRCGCNSRRAGFLVAASSSRALYTRGIARPHGHGK